MNARKLIVNCYAEYKEYQWQAFCLDFTLAAQDDTFEGAKAKLESMIKEYVYDALVGEDKDYADQLLNRRSPFMEWVKYYLLQFKVKLWHAQDNLQYFKETLPLTPYPNNA